MMRVWRRADVGNTWMWTGLFLWGWVGSGWAWGGGLVTNGLTPDVEKPAKEKRMHIVEHRGGTWSPALTDPEKTTLFAIAKDTLSGCVNKRRDGAFPLAAYTLTSKLKADTATFVTLKINGELRGCIGSLAPVEALYQSVRHNAINAALEDPRFNPVQPAELPSITVDVSILSPIRPIASLDEFVIGQHGIILSQGRHRAVFLPEVAVEQRWNKEQTLSCLSQKAGLARDAWQSGASFEVFESVVLSEGPR